MESDVILRFEDYGFKYNAQSAPTLFNISFELHRGEKLLIAGPSGCGKSTLIHSINGLIPFSYKGEMSGSATLFGTEIRDMSLFEVAKHVGTVLQDSDAQFVGLTVAEDIAFALENDCVETPKMHSRVSTIAALVGIDEFLKYAPGDLSGGQKQRVSLGGVLVDDVDILLFDEPLANLDPATGKQAIELIDEMQKQTGVAVIIVEHRLEDVLHRSVDRILLMNSGRIVADMPSDELLSTSLLSDNGIREPLYVTALKYAGVEVNSGMKPSSIESVVISDADAVKVRDFAAQSPAERPKKSGIKLLSVDGCDFSYEKSTRKVLKNISLTVDKGEMVAIVGTNGAGKSTFSKVVCGFENPEKGDFTFDSENLLELSIKERAERIGYVMQNPNQMISKVMIFDEVAFGLKSRGLSDDDARPFVEGALKICGLWPFRNWPVSALSYGQKKRVTIASILALDPKMIILDEPTAGQDYRHYTEIMDFLKELNEKGITIVLITHDMHLMLEYADRAVVFSHGEIIADDEPSAILTNPDIVERASLKETSLLTLCNKCGIEDATDFVRRFINYERSVVRV